MRISNGHWYCSLCNARIDGVSLHKVPIEERLRIPGGATHRVLRVDGRAVHRCRVYEGQNLAPAVAADRPDNDQDRESVR